MAGRGATRTIRKRLALHRAAFIALLAMPMLASAAPVPPIFVTLPTFPVTKIGQSVTLNATITVNTGGNSVIYNSITVAPGFSEFTLGTITGCVIDGATPNTDSTVCTVPVTFAPRLPGMASAAAPIARSAPLLISDIENSTPKQYAFGLTGSGTGPTPVIVPGIITDIVGNVLNTSNGVDPKTGFFGDTGPATSALVYQPTSLAVDSAGNLYISDTGNCVVRRVDKATQIINTVAGIGQTCGAGTDGVAATSSMLSGNMGIALDAAGNLYIADSGNAAVRMVSAATGIITTVAGTLNSPGFIGDGIAATAAQLEEPSVVAVDGYGNIYIGDPGNQLVHKVQVSNGLITIIASPVSPQSIAVDSAGNVYLGDVNAGSLLRVDVVTGNTTTVMSYSATPSSLAFDASDTLHYTLLSDSTVYKLLAGSTNPITEVDGSAPISVTYTDDGNNGIATLAALNQALAVVVDGTGSLYVLEASGVRFVDSTGTLPTPIDFGAVVPPGQSAQQTALLFNGDIASATQPLDVYFNGLSDPFAATDLKLRGCAQATPTTPFAVNAGSYCTLDLVFSPSTLGGQMQSISLFEQPASTQLTQTLTLTGTGGPAEITLTPQTTVYLNSAGQTTPSQTITLTNNRADSIGINDIGFVTNAAGGLTWSQLNNCPVLPALLAGNSSCSIAVTNTPAGGSYFNDLQVYYALDPNHGGYGELIEADVESNGFNGAGNFGANATGVDFGASPIGTPTAPVVLTLTSTGAPPTYTWPMALDSITITGLGAGEFTITGTTCGTTLAVNSNCTVSVDFSPLAASPAGGWNANLSVVYNSADGTPLNVPLNGIAAQPLNINETIHLSDTPMLVPAAPLNITEMIYLSDTSQLVLPTLLAINETIHLSDAPMPIASIVLPINEIIHVSDAPGGAFSNRLTPVVSFTPPTGIIYGSPLTSILTATATYNSAPVAGTFTYTATPTVGNAITLTAITALSPGSYTLAAVFAPTNSATYTTATATAPFTVTKAAASVSLLQLTPVTNGVGTDVTTTFVIAVNDASGGSTGTPTGAVQLYDGNAAIGPVSYLTGATVSVSTVFTSTGNHPITAVYAGDANFSGSTSPIFTESVATPGYTVAANPSSLVIKRGNSGTSTLTLTPFGNYMGTASFSCTGLPTLVSCQFTPASVTFTGNNAQQTVQLQVFTLGPSAVPGVSPKVAAIFLLPGAMLACLVGLRRKKLARGIFRGLLLIVAACVLAGLGACASQNIYTSPVGTSQITVNVSGIGTGSSSGDLVQGAALSITITP